MQTLWTILACFSGVFAFAFLLAGIFGLQDDSPRKDGKVSVFAVLDCLILGGIATALLNASFQPNIRPKERRLLWTGLACLAAFILFFYLADST